MRSLVARLAVWFGASFVLVTAVMMLATHHHLERELHDKNWKKDYPDHPDWKLHGSYSEAEIDDILGELMEGALLYGVPLGAGALVLGYWLARKSVRPISSVNRQLAAIDAHNLSQRIHLPEIDREFRDLVRNINALVERLEVAFAEMNEYAAKVAHELRTPLAILRLKIEQAGAEVPAELSEEVQAELHQLTHVVDQSLLIAKAEQGRVPVCRSDFDLGTMVADIAEDFSLLAQEDDRSVTFVKPASSLVRADATHARQVIHNLFSNAYKHGSGAISVELQPRETVWVLVLRNEMRPQAFPARDTLGIGLRVVDTLLRLQPEVKCRRSSAEAGYGVELEFPMAPPAAGATRD
jgi:signal transduction histidine kinase